MAEHQIEILGQKLSYPTTWHGTSAVFCICACIGFLGFILDKETIDSYSNLFNGSAEAEFNNELLSTNEKLNSDIEELQSTINRLTSASTMSSREKKQVYDELEGIRKEREDAYAKLHKLNEQRSSALAQAGDTISNPQAQQQKQRLSIQQDKILKQLGKIKTQQSEQLKWR